MTVFTASDSASTVEVAPGESFAVELAENPTTGFRWEFAPEPGVELVSSSYAVNDGGGAGGGGTRRFEFRPTEAGEFSLRGRLERAWLGESSAIQRFEIRVRVSASEQNPQG